MKRNLSMTGAVMATVIALIAGPLPAADPAAHSHHQHAASAGEDHSAHQAALQSKRYSVSSAAYDVPDVRLLDTDGNAVDLRSLLYADEPVAVNFIFTTCTTICPVMTATFSQMRRALGDAASEVTMVSITIDPEYDRPAVLKTYAAQFGAGPGWTFLTGESLDIERVLRSFDAYAGSKLNHQPLTFLKRPGAADWVRLDGLSSGESLAQEVTARLLN